MTRFCFSCLLVFYLFNSFAWPTGAFCPSRLTVVRSTQPTSWTARWSTVNATPDPEPTKNDTTPPLSRFLHALYEGITFPFPTLRRLAKKSKSKQPTVTGQFSFREAVAAILVYLCFGAVSYHSTLIQGQGASWSFVDAFYFSIVSLTTVGYGDLCPTTAVGKVFTILFGFSGISILGIAISTIGSRLAAFENEVIQKARQASRQRLFQSLADGVRRQRQKNAQTKEAKKQQDEESQDNTNAITHKGTPHLDTTTNDREGKIVPLWLESLGSVVSKSLPSFALIILGGCVMGKMEGWSLLDSIYYAFISAVTLGYGDFAPVTRRGRLWAILFIPTAVAAAGEVLGNIATQLQEQRHRQYYNALLQRELDLEGLARMDLNHNGQVSREEYVEFMLQEMDLVSAEDFAELHSQFAKLDVDGGGFLDQNDIPLKI